MDRLTFKDYLRTLAEDAVADVMKIQGDIALLDTEISKRTMPLTQQKIRLQKMLAIKQKQAQAEEERSPQNQTMNATQNTAGSQASTPGSAGAQTPGQQQ